MHLEGAGVLKMVEEVHGVSGSAWLCGSCCGCRPVLKYLYIGTGHGEGQVLGCISRCGWKHDVTLVRGRSREGASVKIESHDGEKWKEEKAVKVKQEDEVCIGIILY